VKLKNSYKKYVNVVKKAVCPGETCRKVFERIRGRNILEKIYYIERPGNIPQYRIEGGKEFQQTVTLSGCNGKGHTRILALASGMMELVERYSCYKYFRDGKDARIGTFRGMKSDFYSLNDFPSFVFGFREGSIQMRDIEDCRVRWFKAYTLAGEELYFPFSLAGYLLQGTTGMASGNTLEEALLHAICETVERHCLSKIQRTGAASPTIKISSITNPASLDLINTFQDLGHKVIIKDFSLGMGIPVIGVVRLIDQEHCFVTAGVSPDPAEALIRALTENSQAGIKEHFRLIRGQAYHFRDTGAVDLEDIPGFSSPNIKTELLLIEEILQRQGMRIFFHDATDSNLKIPAVVVMVTNTELLEEIMPSPGGFAAWKNIYLAVVQEYLDMYDYRGALRLIDKFSILDRKNRDIYLCYKGIALKWMQRYSAAARCFREVIDSKGNPGIQSIALFQSGLCYHALGDIKKAGEYYCRIIETNPTFNIFFQWMYYKAVHAKDTEQKRIIDEAANICELLRLGVRMKKSAAGRRCGTPLCAAYGPLKTTAEK